ncbi:M56 family metallopeptidase [Flavobacterium restrictum]|uniref:Peptidase M56 n=1 Tax=Flavobacterium restrictum TaxID=2594428 RepID=A0A553DXS6_9FLAO|nr:M56 family metallopeptidase [Flavobacterium restrictum]TRX37599.1 peptidase M56 [Flavobacterium restrictum]
METLFIFLLKSSGLMVLFYLAYHFLLRKDTFFSSNRWFLLAGLFTSVCLPMVVFTKIVWINPTHFTSNWSKIPVSIAPKNDSFDLNWFWILGICYSLGIVFLILQFGKEFYSLQRVLKGKTRQQQADYILIDLDENIAPFSYFNTIVYNSSLYSIAELENILEHEKIHSEQNHTLDVLVTRVFCIFFWFNPFIWWYKNAILQNLEFIADSEATKKISDKKAYQLTLLKITTHGNCVAITNHFYQSLIKKRIVMLNKNQSKKWSSWKYFIILPALVAFVFLYQIKVIAQEKKQNTLQEKTNENGIDMYTITKNTSEAELLEKAATIEKNFGIKVRFTGFKRNTNNELTAIAIQLKKGTEISENRTIRSSTAIKPFNITINKNSNGILEINFIEDHNLNETVFKESNSSIPNTSTPINTKIIIDGSESDQSTMNSLDPNTIESMNVVKNTKNPEIRITTKKYAKLLSENELYINGEKVNEEEFIALNQNNIDKMDVNKNEKRITITTKKNYKLIPPSPPKFPDGPMPEAPAPDMSKMPTPPNLPSNTGDKKAMSQYHKKMKEFEEKMEAFEPDMSAYEKEIEEIMAKREAIYEKQMALYEEALEKYQEAMEKNND